MVGCYYVGAGMVLSWEQATGLLYSSGDVQRISLWDTHKELKIQVVCGWGSLPHTGCEITACQRTFSGQKHCLSGHTDICMEKMSGESFSKLKSKPISN